VSRDLWGPAADHLAEELTAAVDPAGTLRTAALRRLRCPALPPDPVAPALAGLLAGAEPLREVAARLGFSDRQLRRRSHAAFGYGPVTLRRILRFQRALALARRGLPYAEIAARLGYADQAHLAHEVRDLGGAPLSILTGPGPRGADVEAARRRPDRRTVGSA